VSDYDLSVFDRDFAMEGAEFVRRLMTPWGSIPNASGVLFRRNALTTIDWPGDDLKLCGDWLVYVRLLKKGDIVHIAQPMNYYRIHAVSVSRRYTGFQFIQQSMIVQREMAQQVGLPIDEILRRIGPRYADIIVGDLSAGTAVAPLAQWPLAIRRGWQVAGSIAAGVAVRLIRQRARAFRRWLPR
ncbi:MAG: hypothetical protein INR68_19425, partial [Methylobacterium mesophilicum]|nr:hypothetical protein [Methylobacterium mesophilicum]